MGSIDPRRETLRAIQWYNDADRLFGTPVAETILASGPVTAQQAGHMDASDPIQKSAASILQAGDRPHMDRHAAKRRLAMTKARGRIKAPLTHLALVTAAGQPWCLISLLHRARLPYALRPDQERITAMRSSSNLAAVLVAASALVGSNALANTCRTEKLMCPTSMPVDGFCECTSHGMTQDGTVTASAPRQEHHNATTGGCGSNPHSPGCR